MSYGQVARVAGSPKGARQVVRVLHSMSQKYDLPWHRIVNREGQIVLQDEEAAQKQRALLEQEDVSVNSLGRVNMSEYQYQPDFHVLDDDAFL
ncbi:DNA base-flipping protein [Lentibacillus sp. JNUCC-1]|nr:DNA base-flipping protein [Lentibacillus sp. JNUCC-1]